MVKAATQLVTSQARRTVMVDGYAKVAHNRTYTNLKLSLCPRAASYFMFSLNDLTAFNQ
jgi:hypothetical protein